MHDFVRDMIHFRRDHTYALSPKDWDSGMPFEWKNATNDPADDLTWSGRNIMLHYYDDGNWSEHNELAILVNLHDYAVDFTLPSGRDWGVVVDTQPYYDLPGRSFEPSGFFDDDAAADPMQSANITTENPVAVSGTYQVQPRSIVIVEQMK